MHCLLLNLKWRYRKPSIRARLKKSDPFKPEERCWIVQISQLIFTFVLHEAHWDSILSSPNSLSISLTRQIDSSIRPPATLATSQKHRLALEIHTEGILVSLVAFRAAEAVKRIQRCPWKQVQQWHWRLFLTPIQSGFGNDFRKQIVHDVLHNFFRVIKRIWYVYRWIFFVVNL